MKKIEAIIRTSKFEEVKDALNKIGIEFFSFWEATGVGNEKNLQRTYRGEHGSQKELGRKYKLPYPRIIASWVRTFGADNINLRPVMKDKSKARIVTDKEKALRKENLLLRQELEQKKKELRDSQIKASALDMMIDIAESSLNIQIRKKSGTKQ